MTATPLMTAEEFAALPDDITDHHELVEGELVKVSSATPRHSLIRDNLIFLLRMWDAGSDAIRAITEIDVRTAADTVRRPDISIFSANRLIGFSLDVVPVPEAPMIAIEVLSPSESMMAVSRKAAEYLRAGSLEVWLIDHQNREIHVRSADAEILLSQGKTLESTLLPGFSASVGNLFDV